MHGFHRESMEDRIRECQGYTCDRRVGSFRTDATGLIRAFTQVDTRFLPTTPISDIALSNTSATGWSSATAISVPSGLRVEAIGALQLGDGNSWQLCSLSPGDITLPAPALNTAGSVFMYGSAQSSSDRHSARWSCITNTSSEIKYALGSFSGLPTAEFWLDTRGWDNLTLWRL